MLFYVAVCVENDVVYLNVGLDGCMPMSLAVCSLYLYAEVRDEN